MKIGLHNKNGFNFIVVIMNQHHIISIVLHYLKLIHRWSKFICISLLVENMYFQFVYMWCNLNVLFLSHRSPRTNMIPFNKILVEGQWMWFMCFGKVKLKYSPHIHRYNPFITSTPREVPFPSKLDVVEELCEIIDKLLWHVESFQMIGKIKKKSWCIGWVIWWRPITYFQFSSWARSNRFGLFYTMCHPWLWKNPYFTKAFSKCI